MLKKFFGLTLFALWLVCLGGDASAQVDIPQPPKNLIDSLRGDQSAKSPPAAEEHKPQSSAVEAGAELAQPLPGEEGGSADPARALGRNQIMFVVRSAHPSAVDIAFYSSNRRYAWPGNNRVYTIRDSKTHHYVLNCERGEKICYGAGVRNRYRTYWGSGIGNRHRCPSCCFICNGNATPPIALNP